MVLIISHEQSVDIFKKAAELLLAGVRFSSRIRRGVHVHVLGPVSHGKGKAKEDSNLLALHGTSDTIIVIARSESDVPSSLAVVADAILDAPRPSSRHIRAARKLQGLPSLGDDVVGVLRRCAFSVLVPAICRGSVTAEDARRIERTSNTLISEVGPTLEELPGFDDVRPWAQLFLDDLQRWRQNEISWSDIDRGILLHGASGTGKTLFAQAFARSSRLPFVFASVSKWQSAGHLGDTLAAMRATFDFARSQQPAIVFLDELDSIGDRTKFHGDAVEYRSQIVNFLLECLDGAAGRQKIVTIGATNHPHAIDRAILRSGRIERQIELRLPGPKERADILAYHLGIEVDADVLGVANDLESWTGADLEMLARDARREARAIKRQVSIADVVASLPPLHELPHEATRRISIHEAGHAVVAHSINPLIRIALSMRRTYQKAEENPISYGSATYDGDELALPTREVLESLICRKFGGAAAEEVLLGGRSIGFAGWQGSDLETATRIAIQMVCSHGMGRNLSFYRTERSAAATDLARLPIDLRLEIAEILRVQYERALSIVKINREKIDGLASTLVAQQCLDHAMVAAVLAQHIDTSSR
ncbi:AAA family ATPase [uncultured Agrobacterium sp.]|uniref:AAA family ATPase n=1 Tax=uncultured Agrobacterium sp. TaxID=157277 RepID=UPI0025F4454E|nr:AAA family ATPase [uncultured Agrobacterium sp.]